MGFVSLKEDIEEALFAANLLSERLTSNSIRTEHAERIVGGLLKRCKFIETTMNEIKLLHSDLSHDTRNRIYTLRSERDDALAKIIELELTLKTRQKEFEARISMAAKKIRSQKPLSKGKKRRMKKAMKGGSGFHFSSR